MKKIKPWRYFVGIGLPILLVAGFSVESFFKGNLPESEVGIYNIEVVSEESGPVIEFEVVNNSDTPKQVDQLSVDIDSLIGGQIDSLEINEPMVVEPKSKRAYRLEWGDKLGIRGWVWARVGLGEAQPNKKLAWYLPRIDWSSPASIAAVLPILGFFILRKTFFT